MADVLSRDIPLLPGHSALLFIDTQTYTCEMAGGEYQALSPLDRDRRYGYFFDMLETSVIPNWRRLQTAFRECRIEVLYTVIQSLTADGRDRSLDYKISGFHVPPGSADARVIDAIRPGPDEIVIAGVLTDQCIDSAVRDACDLGYLVTLVTDACATHSAERHASSLRNNAGYARQTTTAALIGEVHELAAARTR
jgi:ureidoacrylate peracid hydrolase